MYFYCQSGDSISRGGLKRRDFDLYDAAKALSDLTECEDYGQIRQLGKVKEARTAFSLLCRIAYYGINDDSIDRKTVINKLTGEHRKNMKILLTAPIGLKRKFLVVSLGINFRLTELLVRTVRKFQTS